MPTRVLILGAGYAGAACAAALDAAARRNEVEVTVVDPTGVVVRTPLLSGVVAGRVPLERSAVGLHVVAPRARLVPGRAVAADPVAKTVTVRDRVTGADSTHGYDHLVVTLGGVCEDRRVAGAATSLGFRTPADALELRSRLFADLAAAARTADVEERERRCTTVVVGGGLAGCAVAGAAAHLKQRAARRLWPELLPHLRVVLVELKARLLSHHDRSLSGHVESVLADLGVEVATGDPVTEVTPDGAVVLRSGSVTSTDEPVWTAGARAHPLAERLLRGAEVSTGGRIVVTPNLQARGVADVWAAGDAAAVPDLLAGGEAPAIVGFAVAAGRRVARNILRVLDGEYPAALRYRAPWEVVPLGHATASRVRGRLTTRARATLADAELALAAPKQLTARLRSAWDGGDPTAIGLDRSEIVASESPSTTVVSLAARPR